MTMTTELLLNDEYCERCGKKNITDDGTCRSCGFKCWHVFH